MPQRQVNGSGAKAGLLMRCDGDARIGLGHLMRCLTLAEEMRERGAKVTLVTVACPEAVSQQFTALGVAVEGIMAKPGSSADAQATLNKSAESPVILLDGYVFDFAYQQCLREAGKKLALIDDLASEDRYAADIIFNQNAGFGIDDYEGRGEAQLLLGPDYALLRREFRETPRPQPRRGPVERLLVSLGGADPINATTAVITALEGCAGPLSVDVLLGAANPFGDVVELMASSSSHRVKVSRAAGDMAARMAKADAAIIGGGISLFEAMFMGLPCFAAVIADNQLRGVNALKAQGYCSAMDMRSGIDVEHLHRAFRLFLEQHDARASMAKKTAELVNGAGVARFADALEKLMV